MAAVRSGSLCALFVFALVLPREASAQMFRGWGIKGGVIGSYQTFSYSTGFGSPEIPRVPRWGYSAGLFMELLDEGIVNMVIEAGYTQKGRTVTSQEISRAPNEPGYLSTGPEGITPWGGYLTTSLAVKLRAHVRGTTPYFSVGPRFDFLVYRPTEPASVFRYYRKNDIGVNVAVGLEIIPRRHPVLAFEARWSPGLSPIFSNNIVVMKNMTAEFLVLVWF